PSASRATTEPASSAVVRLSISVGRRANSTVGTPQWASAKAATSPVGPPPITVQVRGVGPFMFALGGTLQHSGASGCSGVVQDVATGGQPGGTAFAPESDQATLRGKGIPGSTRKMKLYRRLGEAGAAMLLLLAPAMWN